MSISTKLSLLVLLLLLLLVPANAFAETTGPQWTVSSVSRPTNFKPGGNAEGDEYVVLVTNTGAAASVGSVTITDELPAGLEPAPGVSAEDELGLTQGTAGFNFSGGCEEGGERKVSCTYGGVVQSGDTLILEFPVSVSKEAPQGGAGGTQSLTNVVRVSGGGAPAAAMRTETTISPEPAKFGISPGGSSSALSSVQAGAHPNLTVATAFNTENLGGATVGSLKDTTYDLPPGFAGDLVDTPACSATDFLREECPIATQVGVTTITLDNDGEPQVNLKPVYNLAPEPGEVGKLGFWVDDFFYEGDVKVREPGEGGSQPAGGPGEPYGLKTTFYNVTAGLVAIDNISLTIWGVPANSTHDPLRWYPGELDNGSRQGSHFGVSSNATEAPYFTNPTSCTSGPLEAAFKVTSWQNPNESEHPEATRMSFGPFVDCDALVMEPSLTAEVSSDKASAPTGLDVDTKVTQTYDNAQGLAAPTLKQEVVTLPEGMTVNPSSGVGLAACSEAQFAEEETTERTEQEKAAGHGCPNESKLATVKIKTPSISEEVTGSAFLATPYANPFSEPGHPGGSLLALYLIARAPARGVLIKAPGLVQANELTGRLTTTFGATPAFAGMPASPGLPPLPASLITFAFNQGAGAPLVTPPACGAYTVEAALTSWANPAGSPLTPEISPFQITNGFNGGACPGGGVPPFSPRVAGGTENNVAGSYSPLELALERNDGEQEITGFSTVLPVGLTGDLSGVAECGEAEVQRARAQTGVEAETSPACPANSEIGYSVADAGVGKQLAQAPGKIYLGGPFEGAPFSVVAITSAHVGPFDLGTVVIHFPLDINPGTAQVSIPAGPGDQIPHIIKGIVIHVREIHAYINRHDFMINPTSCEHLSLSATVLGNGASANSATITDPFQAADCSSLKFEPKFAVSTSGKTSKADGASLHVALTYPAGALTNDSNIKYVKVDLPKALPSRLTTLQRACLQKEFRANPASCPPESVIGTARAVTPILPVPLEGPVYFVSNGGEAFPNLIMVLQGDGVTIRLVGDTYISPQGVTSSTFNTIPDQPVTSFELNLPEKKFSALGTNKNLCDLTGTKTIKTKIDKRVKGKLVRKNGKLVKETKKVTKTVKEPLIAPTAFVGQNGATFNQQTVVSVTGCPKAKVAKKKAAKKKKKGSKKKK